MDALYLRGQPLFLWLVGLLALSGGLIHRPLLHGEALQPHALCETLHQQRRRKRAKTHLFVSFSGFSRLSYSRAVKRCSNKRKNEHLSDYENEQQSEYSVGPVNAAQ